MVQLWASSKAEDSDDESNSEGHHDELTTIIPSSTSNAHIQSICGVPAVLAPYYLSFMLDAIAVGMVMPVLPFTIMELGANALQLSLVVSANYVAQSIGVLVMGRISDQYGRRVAFLSCLLASTVSYIALSHAESLHGIAFARIISGSFGGLLPVMQSTVADTVPAADRPMFLGRIGAAFGLGFVAGPALSAALSVFTTQEKIRFASILPFLGFAFSYLFATETKISTDISMTTSSGRFQPKPLLASKSAHNSKKLKVSHSFEIVFLVLNGFAVMYAFATETIYAMFIKDIFGFDEHSLSLLFVTNGLLIGLFQMFLIKYIVLSFGNHLTLALGNLLLSVGMAGFSLIRQKSLHFFFFSSHLIGYSIADTTLASLITRYSTSNNQGRNLSYNQAGQAAARALGPLLAGYLYEFDKSLSNRLPTDIISVSASSMSSMSSWNQLPTGSLPFLVGALLPAVAIVIPLFLYSREISVYNRRNVSTDTTTATLLSSSVKVLGLLGRETNRDHII
jgi:MFS transporter, DHA1 family, tetracycline resistance protein